jgi:hypothetical protein
MCIVSMECHHLVSQAVKLEREKRKTEREARLWELFSDPNVRRLVLLALIVAYSTHVTRSKTQKGPIQSALAMTLPTIGIPLLAADAGIRDWKALAVISGVSGGFAALEAELGLNDVGRSLLDSVTLEGPGGFPFLSLAGPIPAIQWFREKFD